MKMGSMERTLTAKSLNFRQICQWTAATSLVATGAVALFSANTLDKLSQNGRVRLDLEGFEKVASITVALDRVSEERAILEEKRLISQANFAAAESLPKVKVAFKPITSKKTVSKSSVVRERKLSGAELAEIAFLETAPDPAVESAAMAQVYRGLRSRFIAAADGVNQKSLEASPNELLAGEAFEYDEVPEFDPADFQIADDAEPRVLAREDLDAKFNGTPVVETAPAVLYDSKVVEDTITTVASAPTLAPSPKASMEASPKASALDGMPSDFVPLKNSIVAAKVVATPGIDLVPEVAMETAPTQAELPVTNQKEGPPPATGPPDDPAIAENTSVIESAPAAKAAVEPLVVKESENANIVSAEPLPSSANIQGDLREYAEDIQSVYVADQEQSEESAEYSSERVSAQRPENPKDLPGTITTQQSARRPNAPENMGSGITRDAGGITIDWNDHSGNGWKSNDTESGGKIYVGKPNSDLGRDQPTLARNESNPLKPNLSAEAVRDLQKKFSFDSASRVAADRAGNLSQPKTNEGTTSEPAVENKTCDTVRLGVEALQPGAENETLAICRRVFSHEGEASQDQARWWENHNSESGSEHWPTLTHQKPSEMNAKDRVPLLSTASIRILSAISRASTHQGMGIVFGRVAQGLDLKLVGRSDAPIYLDAGMKVRDPKAVSSISRQFVILNVEPGQPLLLVKDSANGVSGSIPLVVKAGMATHLDVSAPQIVGLDLTIFDSSASVETRMANLTAEVIGQPGKLAISNSKGALRLEKIAVFGDFPIYVDLTQSEKSYKNRFRIGSDVLLSKKPAQNLYFFREKRVTSWLSQLAGGVSPHSGLIVGLLPREYTEIRAGRKPSTKHLKIGILEKKSTLIPERYHLDRQDGLVSESKFQPGYERYIGIQIPEGPCVPTVIDDKGVALWSTLVYAQPGVINVVTP